MKQFNNLIKEFNRKVEDILFRFDYAVLEIKILENSDLLNFLYSTINPISVNVNLRVPPLGFSIDEWLSCSQMEIKNGMLKVGNEYTKVVSIKLFPDAVVPQVFSELEKLKFFKTSKLDKCISSILIPVNFAFERLLTISP